MIIPFLTSLYESRVHKEDWQDRWDELLHEIQLYSLSSQVFHLIRQSGLSDRFPLSFMEALKFKAEKVMFHNMLVKRETVNVLKALEQEGIPVIPLKGVIFSERYFGGWAVRGTSDVDLLIRREDLERAVRCVRGLGFQKEDRYHSLHYHTEYFKDLPAVGESISVELHWNLLRKHTSEIRMERLWSSARPLVWADVSGACCKELPLDHTFYAICLHSSKHHMLSLKHVLDVVHLIYRYGPSIDLERIMQMAREDGTCRQVRAALTVAYRMFPGLNRILPFTQPVRLPFFRCSLIREAEQRIKSYRYYAYLFCYPLITLDQWKYRRLHLYYLLFPPKDRVARMIGEKPDSRAIRLYWKLYKHRYRVYRSHQHSAIKK